MNATSRIRTLVAALAAVSGLAVALPAAAEVVVSDAWTYATAPGAKAGAYMVLTNTGDEERALVRMRSPVSDEIGVFRANRDAQGAMRMWPVSRLRLEPGESLLLEPSAYQFSLGGLKAPFEVGQKIPLLLWFEGQLEITVQLEVRPPAPVAAAADHSSHAH